MCGVSLGTSFRRGGGADRNVEVRARLGAPSPSSNDRAISPRAHLYHPPDIGTYDNSRDEFIEVANVTSQSVPLYDPAFPTNHWRLRDAVDFDFPAGLSLPAGGRVVVVSFDPVNDTNSLAGFQQRYG